MNLRNELICAQHTYARQLAHFISLQEAAQNPGAGEVKLELSEEISLFRRLYCADFAAGAETHSIIELEPEIQPLKRRIETEFEGLSVIAHALRWDDVVIEHDAEDSAEALLEDWFEHWFDPDDVRHDPAQQLGCLIHALIVEDGKLWIDFGSASATAFESVLKKLRSGGAKQVTITASRGAPTPP